MLFRTPTLSSPVDPVKSKKDAWQRLLIAAAILLGLAAAALLFDVNVCRFCMEKKVPGDLRRLLTWSELFAHGIGVILIAGLIYVLDRDRRRFLPRILTMAFGAGAVADLIKLNIGRFRPHHLSPESVWESFAGWAPFLFPPDGFSRFDHRLQSFPSAHSAVATGLALALSRIYPQGRYLFAVFAVLAASQRIECGAHYLSDTLGGAAVGFLTAAVLSREGKISRFFAKLETPPETIAADRDEIGVFPARPSAIL